MLTALALALFQEAKKDEAPAFGPMEVGIAAEVLGAHFSQDELELMLPDVLERLKEFEKLRAVPLANDVASALVFVPLPSAFASKTSSKESVMILASGPAARPADLEELAYYPIGELELLIRRRLVSSEELVQVFLRRLKRLDPQLHCVVTLLEDRA
ncbi:MAG: amidase, partial [Planctomycetota bacterium]